ncbi:MAG: hypothetical protein RLZ77_750, partial [Bacteroidota bacterium]
NESDSIIFCICDNDSFIELVFCTFFLVQLIEVRNKMKKNILFNFVLLSVGDNYKKKAR